MQRFVIVNKYKTPLSAFHSNGGWEIKDVFPCSRNNYYVFDTEEKAYNKIAYMINQCNEQRPRWKEWTDTALNYVKAMKVKAIYY